MRTVTVTITAAQAKYLEQVAFHDSTRSKSPYIQKVAAKASKRLLRAMGRYRPVQGFMPEDLDKVAL